MSSFKIRITRACFLGSDRIAKPGDVVSLPATAAREVLNAVRGELADKDDGPRLDDMIRTADAKAAPRRGGLW